MVASTKRTKLTVKQATMLAQLDRGEVFYLRGPQVRLVRALEGKGLAKLTDDGEMRQPGSGRVGGERWSGEITRRGRAHRFKCLWCFGGDPRGASLIATSPVRGRMQIDMRVKRAEVRARIRAALMMSTEYPRRWPAFRKLLTSMFNVARDWDRLRKETATSTGAS